MTVYFKPFMKKVSMETAKETIQIYKKGGRICSLNGKIFIIFFYFYFFGKIFKLIQYSST